MYFMGFLLLINIQSSCIGMDWSLTAQHTSGVTKLLAWHTASKISDGMLYQSVPAQIKPRIYCWTKEQVVTSHRPGAS